MAKKTIARDELTREKQKELICLYRAQSCSFREIADRVSKETGVKVSHVTVFNDYMKILKEAKERVSKVADYNMIIELEKLERLEHQYWRAWEKSLGKTSKKKIRKNGKKETDSTQIEAEESDQNGEVSFLNGIRAVIKQRCDLLGLSTAKIDLTTGGDKINSNGPTEVIFRRFDGSDNKDGE